MGIFQKIKAWDKKNSERQKIKQLEKINIKCPLCKAMVPSTALRCSHCTADLTPHRASMDLEVKRYQKTQLTTFIVVLLLAVGTFTYFVSGGEDQSQVKQIAHTGDQAILHMNESPDSIVFIATTEDAYGELMQTFVAHDVTGMLQMGAQGKVFGVTNGSKVLVIDRAFGKRKVRITEGVKVVDKDKVGRSGWVSEEWLQVVEK